MAACVGFASSLTKETAVNRVLEGRAEPSPDDGMSLKLEDEEFNIRFNRDSYLWLLVILPVPKGLK